MLNNMKLLYIGQRIDRIASGADQVNKRNQQLLREIFQEQLVYLEPSVTGVLDNLVLGVNKKLINSVKRELDKGDYTHLFIGQYFKTIGLRALPFYLIVKWWEKIGCKYSDKFITLNKRDSELLKTIYGKDSSVELPTSFDDRFDLEKANAAARCISGNSIAFLFVSVAFFANLQGVQWMIDNVIPYVQGNFYIVGKGMDKVAFKHLTSNIYIYGFVEDLTDFYYRARIVVSPIFVGGGMRTKTAEALMYGKSIVGTKEAFEGYQMDSRCMYMCSTPDEFIQTITTMQDCKRLNPYSRELYNQYYSTGAALCTLKNIFNE